MRVTFLLNRFLRIFTSKQLCLISCLSLLVNAMAYSQGKWELRRNENGIEVYSRTPLAGERKEIRVLCQFNTSKAKLIRTIQDISDYGKWVYSTKENKIIKTISPTQSIYYAVSHLPWPLKDRDLIVELNITDTKENRFEIEAKSLPDYLPKNNTYIRVPYSRALWDVTVLNDHALKIDYTFSVDPGGSIPSWLTNATLPVGPYNSFYKLKTLLEREE